MFKNPVQNLLLLHFTVNDHQFLLPINWLLQSLKLAAQKRFLNKKLYLLRLSEVKTQEKGIEGKGRHPLKKVAKK